MPMNLDILRDGAELGQSLFKHDAKYYEKCYEMFSNAKLDRMEKNGTNIETGNVRRIDQQQDCQVIYLWNSPVYTEVGKWSRTAKSIA